MVEQVAQLASVIHPTSKPWDRPAQLLSALPLHKVAPARTNTARHMAVCVQDFSGLHVCVSLKPLLLCG